MSRSIASVGPTFSTLPRLAAAATRPPLRALLGWLGLHAFESRVGQRLSRSFRERLALGEPVYLLGLSAASHNTGVALIECRAERGARVVANLEEERFSGEKHCQRFPEGSLLELERYLARLGATVDDIHCVLSTWDYVDLIANGLRASLEHAPRSLLLARNGATIGGDFSTILQGLGAPKRLARTRPFAGRRLPLIMMGHHENHAYQAFATSPFATTDKATLILVLDGFGDRGALSVFLADGGRLQRLYCNDSQVDSLGIMYGVISSTQGGWTVNSSEGRYMGAAAWGDGSRLRNRYYRQLRELLHLGPDGQVLVNRSMAGWQFGGLYTPYRRRLEDVLGPPIVREKMWNPDAILNVDDVEHAAITRERVDKAAALQMVFEDGLFHVVEHWVRQTGAEELLLTGGTALNCVANMQLMEQLDESYYAKQLSKRGRLSIWVPPTPGDAGVPMGAALQFAMRSGVRPAARCFDSPYLCGLSAEPADLDRALSDCGQRPMPDGCRLAFAPLGNCDDADDRAAIAALMARAVSSGGVLGLYQGGAETGPRALGNRSILADPCNPESLSLLNAKVKYRERVRPLAPMVTLEAARELFELAPAAEDYDFRAYEYMVLTVRARPAAKLRTPAIVHEDGTSRIQIVRPTHNRLVYAYLKAMGREVGVEASVNTSLNVGSPIVQTPAHALQVLQKARALDGLIMVDADGHAQAVWLDGERASGDVSRMPKWLRERQVSAPLEHRLGA